MGNLLCPQQHGPVPDWDAVTQNPYTLGRKLAARMDVQWPSNGHLSWPTADEWNKEILDLKHTATRLAAYDPRWWDTVWNRCDAVEKIQLFKGEREATQSEYFHLVTTCQEPWRCRLLAQRLDAAAHMD